MIYSIKTPLKNTDINLLFGVSKSDNKKYKEDKNTDSKNELHENKDEIVVEETTETKNFID